MEEPIHANPLVHTRALLTYLLATHSKSRTSSSSNTTSPILLGVKNLAIDSGVSSASTESEGGDYENGKDGLGTEGTSTAPSSAASDTGRDEDRMDAVIHLLEDTTVEDDDRPEVLKELLSNLLIATDGEQLDSFILNLLHRYREDLYPSSTPVPPLPSHGSLTPSRPTVSRSSSFRRHLQSGIAMSSVRPSPTPSLSATANNAFSSSISNASSRSAPTSPFLPASPSVRGTIATPSHSPWSSPRPTAGALSALNASANDFKFSPGASEFRPGSGAGSGSGTSSHPRSPVNAHQAQANWAFTSSPLGTPKFGVPSDRSGASANSSPGYFPKALEGGALGAAKLKVPRLPWADTDSSSDSLNENEEEGEEEPPYEGEWLDQQSLQQYGDQGIAFPVGGMGGWDPFGPIEGQEGYAAGFNGGAGGGEGDFQSTYETGEGDGSGEFPGAFEAGLGGMGAYSMTPFDVLYSIFAGSDVSAATLEESLVMTGWDVDAAMEYIINTQPQAGGSGAGGEQSAPPSPAPVARQISMGSGSRPLVVSRDSFEGFQGGGNGGRGGAWGQQSQQQQQQPQGQGQGGDRGGGRVCRYYLSGNCLRSDCKFSHRVELAVCKFWLRGHCLKGDGQCEFLHSIPPIMRADFERRARNRAGQNQNQQGYDQDQNRDEGPDLDFPTLGQAPRSRRAPVYQQQQARVQQQQQFAPQADQFIPDNEISRNAYIDPARTRFSGAVKFGTRPTSLANARASSNSLGQPAPSQQQPRGDLPRPRRSPRLTLRPPVLLPTLPTGAALAALYVRYRASFLELGANRNKCLSKASDCWRRGDGQGARKFSREAQDWNRQVAIEGRDSANRIVQERLQLFREALGRNEGRAGCTDDAPDRKARGRDRGGGICLGVVSQKVLPRGERVLTVEERTECALDLHGLHADEAISFLGSFLTSLERERYAGLAYVVIGQSKHSGNNGVRLENATLEFLAGEGYAWNSYGGILAIDVLR